MAGGQKLRVSCGPVATFNPSKQEAKGGSDEAQDSIVLSMSNELLYLVPELHTRHHTCARHGDVAGGPDPVDRFASTKIRSPKLPHSDFPHYLLYAETVQFG